MERTSELHIVHLSSFLHAQAKRKLKMDTFLEWKLFRIYCVQKKKIQNRKIYSNCEVAYCCEW